MPDNVLRNIIQWTTDVTGLKQNARVMSDVERRARSLSTTMSSNAKFLDASVSRYERNGKQVVKTTALFTDGQRKMAIGWQDAGKGAKNVNERILTYNRSARNAVPITTQLTKALSRVAIVVPIWFLFRRVISGAFRALKDGLTDIVEFDRILQKSRRNLQGSAQDIAKNFDLLKVKVQELSVETGESVQDITYAFQRFATTGLDFETSMAGATASVRTAIIMFGETKQVANAVARAFRVLGGRTTEFATKGEELTSFLALTAELWKTNAFDINEFAGALERIAPTAKSSNLSLNETAILLSAIHTAGIRGTRAGRLLSTMILQMEKNFDKINQTLGTNIKEADSTFDRILNIAKALEQLNKSRPIEASQAISSLFRIRGGQVVRSITAMLTELEKMKDIKGDVAEFNRAFEDVDAQVHRVMKRFNNLNKEMSRAFVAGITGAESFVEGMQKVTKLQEQMLDNAKAFGFGLRIAFKAGTFQFATMRNEFEQLDKVSLSKAQKSVEELFNLSKIKDASIIRDLIENIDEAIPRGIFGVTDEAQAEMRKVLEERLKALEAIEESERNIAKAQEDQNTVQKETITFRTSQKVAKLILAQQVQLLKLQGASNSQLIREEMLRARQLGIIEDEMTILKRQLNLEKAITEEQRLRNKLSSDSVKLFRIAQEHGIKVAETLGDVLAGQVDFGSFVRRGGKDLEVLKDQFKDIFEQQQALAFFRGERVPGLEGLQGGERIAIREEAIRKGEPARFSARAQFERAKAERALPRIKTDIEARIEVNIKRGLSEEVAQQIVDIMHQELQKKKGVIQEDVKNIMEEF